MKVKALILGLLLCMLTSNAFAQEKIYIYMHTSSIALDPETKQQLKEIVAEQIRAQGKEPVFNRQGIDKSLAIIVSVREDDRGSQGPDRADFYIASQVEAEGYKNGAIWRQVGADASANANAAASKIHPVAGIASAILLGPWIEGLGEKRAIKAEVEGMRQADEILQTAQILKVIPKITLMGYRLDAGKWLAGPKNEYSSTYYTATVFRGGLMIGRVLRENPQVAEGQKELGAEWRDEIILAMAKKTIGGK